MKSPIKTGLVTIGISALVIAIGSLLYWLAPKNSNPQLVTPTAASASQSANVASVPTLSDVAPSSQAQLPPLPRSLAGTQVDGEIIIDDNKQLVVTAGLRRLFDYFLSAQGEESLEIIKARVKAYINTHTPEPAATQAQIIFDKYLTYLNQVGVIEKRYAPKTTTSERAQLDLLALNQQQQAVKKLRQQLFNEKTRQAFFMQEEALNDYTLQVISTNQNTNLTEEQRQQSMQQAREQYIRSFADPQVQQKIRERINIESLLTETERLKQQGATQEQLNAMRRQYVDEAAVQRLAELDKQEAAFANRVKNFQQQRQQILQTQGNTPQAQQAIQQLMDSQFNKTEQLRLSVVNY